LPVSLNLARILAALLKVRTSLSISATPKQLLRRYERDRAEPVAMMRAAMMAHACSGVMILARFVRSSGWRPSGLLR
jgi:hypothetical protein